MNKNTVLTLVAAIAAQLTIHAADDHGHSHAAKAAGPNGGRLISAVEPHAEFLLTPDRKIQITFVGENGQSIAPDQQVVTVTTGERSAPVKLTFVKTGEVLISEQVVPEGNNLPVVVQIKTSPEAKTVIEKFHLNPAICPGCQKAEYACTCEHGH
ncbi:MAG: hypothetical protein ACOYM3_00930 [Terrimicrobiaceae bacterium]